jgi:hypothetical protein
LLQNSPINWVVLTGNGTKLKIRWRLTLTIKHCSAPWSEAHTHPLTPVLTHLSFRWTLPSRAKIFFTRVGHSKYHKISYPEFILISNVKENFTKGASKKDNPKELFSIKYTELQINSQMLFGDPKSA